MPSSYHGETTAPHSIRLVGPTVVRGWKSMFDRRRNAALDLIDDLIILTQFAFGREYGYRPPV